MERSTVHLLHKRGKSLREIASELGRSKTTIARALSEAVDRPPSTRRRKSLVDLVAAARCGGRQYDAND